jgi:hypothetical protein
MEEYITQLYKYALVVHDNEFFKEKNWIDSFINEIKTVGCYYSFEQDGQLWSGKIPKGLYQFIDIAELNSHLSNKLLLKQNAPILESL